MKENLILALFFFTIILSKSFENIIETEYGKVKGLVKENHIEFMGIPFVKPPIGDLRWKRPQKIEKWEGVVDTTKIKPACPQFCILPKETCPKSYSEDCIYLNVYVPKKKFTEPLPVFAYIHVTMFINLGVFSYLNYIVVIFNKVNLVVLFIVEKDFLQDLKPF
jgi:para-nitrobenzyl esterase